jgi:hypothetical protein
VAKAELGVKKGGMAITVGLTSVLSGRDPWRRTFSCAMASAGDGSPLRFLPGEGLLGVWMGRGGGGL